MSYGGEELQPQSLYPCARRHRQLAVPRKACLQRLLLEELEYFLQRYKQAGIGRVRGLALFEILPSGVQVKVEIGHGSCRCRFPATLAQRHKPQAWRQHQRLLRSGNDRVQIPVIHLHRVSAQAGDSVHHHQRRMPPAHLAQGLHVLQHAGGGLILHQQHGPGPSLLTGLLQGLLGHCLAAGHSHPVHLGAIDLSNQPQSFAELPRVYGHHTLAWREQIDNSRFHGARAGGSERQHRLARAEQRLQPCRDSPHQVLEAADAV